MSLKKRKPRTRASSNKLLREEEKIISEEKRVERTEKKLEKTEKKLEREEEVVVKDEKKVITLEKQILFKFGSLKFTKKHAFDFAKITAGALLGTGFGLNFIDSNIGTAMALSWPKTVGVVVVALVLASVLMYSEDKTSSCTTNTQCDI